MADVNKIPLTTTDTVASVPPGDTSAAPPPPPPGGLNTPTNDVTPSGDARDYIANFLREYGLESLSGWAWQQIVDGASPEQVIQALRDRPEYAAQFPGMALRKANGLPAISEAEYLSYQRQAYQLMRQYNLPSGFYDEPTDFANFIGKDISVNELNLRISNAYTRVAQAPPNVRQAFTDFFGPNGDSALASYFMDADRALPILERQAAQAEIAGTSRDFGFNVDANKAGQLADIGVTADEARKGFQDLSTRAALFDERVSEKQDLTAENQGVSAEFGLNDQGARDLQRRQAKRQADFSGTGGAASTQQGVIGTGSTQRGGG